MGVIKLIGLGSTPPGGVAPDVLNERIWFVRAMTKESWPTPTGASQRANSHTTLRLRPATSDCAVIGVWGQLTRRRGPSGRRSLPVVVPSATPCTIEEIARTCHATQRLII
jgi:hypothetical protein